MSVERGSRRPARETQYTTIDHCRAWIFGKDTGLASHSQGGWQMTSREAQQQREMLALLLAVCAQRGLRPVDHA